MRVTGLRIASDCYRKQASRWRYDFVCHALRNIMGCPNGQDIVVVDLWTDKPGAA
jgi:hypothetical protein